MSRGQYLERPALVSLGDAVLEGLWHRGTRAPPLLVVPPPPGEGSMDHVICAELAWAAAHDGRPVLRFNFRGVGASQGEPGDERARLEDAAAALRLLVENTGRPEVAVVATGRSASLVLRLAREHPGVCAVVLVSPPADALAGPVSVPVLCIAAEGEEGLAGLTAAARALPARVEVVPAADARFQRNLPEVGRLTIRWLGGPGNPAES